jgi:hypothetical protein
MMNKYKLLTFLIAVLLVTQSYAQTEALPVKHNIKLRMPLSYNGLFSQWITAGLQYERLISAKNSLNLGTIYYYSKDNRFSSYRENINSQNHLLILPQWRHYFRKNEQNYFNGFYVGASAAYVRSRIDWVGFVQKSDAMGLGGLIGYQQVIKKKLSIGFTPSLHYGLENSNNPSYGSISSRRTYPVFIGSLDLHIGYIFR